MIELKLATINDNLEQIILDIKNSRWSEASEINVADYSVPDLEDFLKIEENVFILAYLEGEFAGMASAKLLNKPTGDRWLYVDEMDVCENKQRKGVGTELMKYLLSFAKDKDCEELWLGTEVDNLPANKLYQSLNPDEVQNFVGYNYIVK